MLGAELTCVRVVCVVYCVSLIGLLQDRPVQQFGANQDDLYIVGGTPWGLVNYMLTELSSHGTATFSKNNEKKNINNN